ncbi:MFS transporter [Candidatus Formimonas warabiya]|uniref:Major facilitator superfamily (MFS) profile domain-containing protein n=1 Tax=Formimonas warabiya TaxID=1761012 RepID=A0A3G1KTH2_FORW1|nr:MFS transporter [Candidatus Formimonas warabiya]ATW25730.1 hypothetical protein DCMF_14020 [Candidatus Formimonas warabiya]
MEEKINREEKIPYRRIWLVCLNIIFALAGLSIVSPILPQIKAWQDVSYSMMGFFVASYAMSRVVVDLPSGILVDRWGTCIVTLSGFTVSALGSLMCGFAPNLYFLIAGRILSGVGSGLAVTSLQTELILLAPPAYRSRSMSYFMLARRAGGSLFPFLGGVLAAWGRWRNVFFMVCVLNVIGAAIALFTYSARKSHQLKEKDQVLQEEKNGDEKEAFSFFQGKFLVIYLVALAIFLNRDGVERTLVPFFGSTLSLNSVQIGLGLTLSSLASLGGIYLGGRAADHWGRKLVLLVGVAFLVLGNSLFLFVHNYAMYLGVSLIFGVVAFNMGLPNVIIADMSPRRHIGKALGLGRLFNDLGTVIGPLLLTQVIDRFGFGVSFYFGIFLMTLAFLLVAVFLPETRKASFSGTGLKQSWHKEG